jgi:hypothetical protein
MEEKFVYVKIKTLAQLLGTGLVPKGSMLLNTSTEAEFRLDTIKAYQGLVCQARETGAEVFSHVIDGSIFSRDMVLAATTVVETKEKSVYVVFEDGTALLPGGTLVDREIAGAFAAGIQKSQGISGKKS